MTLSAHSDTKLVRLAQRGDQEAFRLLIEHHAGLVYAIARSRLRDPETAEDLVQEVFLRVHLNFGQLRDPERLTAWLSQMTRNLATDWLRRGQRRSQIVPMVPLEDQTHDIPDTSTRGTRDMVDDKQRGALLDRAIEMLPADQREVVLLHCGEEMSQREIAQHLGTSPMKVNRLLKKAIASMKSMVDPTNMRTELRVPRPVVNRTAALVIAAAAMSASSKAAMAAAAAESAQGVAVGSAVVMGSTGFLSTIAAKLAAGGTVMGLGKTAVAAGAVIIGVVAYTNVKSGGETKTPAPDLGPAVVNTVVNESSNTTGELIALAYRPDPGDRWTMNVNMGIEQQIMVPNQPQPVRTNMDMYAQAIREVIDVDDLGQITLRESLGEWGINQITVNGRAMDPNNFPAPEASILDSLKDTRSTMLMDSTGAVVSVEVEFAGQSAGSLGQVEQISEMFSHANVTLPPHAVRVGDTWTSTFEFPGVAGAWGEVNCELVRMDVVNSLPVAVIEFHSELQMDHDINIDVPEGMMPMPENVQADITYERIHCRMEGQVLFAQDLNRTVNERMTVDIDMGLRIEGYSEGQAFFQRVGLRQLMRINTEAPRS